MEVDSGERRALVVGETLQLLLTFCSRAELGAQSGLCSGGYV